jgi:hypothetical protein
MNLSSINLRFFANIAPLLGGLNKAERAMDRTGRKMEAVGRNLTKSITAPMVALGAVAINTFQGFELEMAKVRAISGATSDEFMKLKANAEKLGASTVFSAKQVAGLQVEFAKLGFTASEIDKVTESTLYLAQAAQTDLARAAEVAGSTLRAFGLNASETGRVTDVMAKSFSTSALDMEKFAESMKYVAPVANAAGISIEETTAMLAVMANAGIKGSQAGTSLRRIISELGAGTEPVAEKIKKLANSGLGLDIAMDEVGRSAQSALLVLGKGIDQVDPLTKSFEQSGGAAKAMANMMDDTLFGSMKGLQSATEGALIQIGEIMSVGFRPLVGAVTSAVKAFNNMNPNIKKFAIGLGIALAIVGPMILGIGSITRAYVAFKTILLATNPLLLAFTATAGIIGGLLFMQSSALDDNTKSLIKNGAEANILLETLKRENISQETRNSLITKFNTKFGSYIGNLKSEGVAIEDISKAQKELNKQFALKIKQAGMEKVLNERMEDAAELAADILLLEERRTAQLSNLRSLERVGGDTADDELFLRNAIDATNNSIISKTQSLDNLVKKTAELQSKVDALLPVLEEVGDEPESPTGLEGLGEDADKTTGKIRTLSDEIDRLASLEKQYYTEMAKVTDKALKNSIQPLALGLDEITWEDYEDPPAFEKLPKGFANMQIAATQMTAAISSAINQMAVDTIVGMSEMIGAMASGQATMADFGSFVMGSFAGLLSTLGKILIEYGAGLLALKLATISLQPGVALAAGAALLAIGAGVKSKLQSASENNIPMMAEGGIVTGPTLAMIGEGRGPEAVIPLDKLDGFMGGGAQNINVTGRIQGSDILLSQERATRERSRYRGY